MTDTYFEAETDKEKSTQLALRQQGPDYARFLTVAPSGPCEAKQPIRILRLPEVMDRVGLCRASIYLHMARGKFPKQISLGPRAVGWLEHEIDAWLAARIKFSREGAAPSA